MAEVESSQPTVTSSAETQHPKPSFGSRLRLFFWKLMSLVLLIALVAAIVLWKPWQPNIKANDRTVSVTGIATLKAEPDEFVFYPSYEFTNADKKTALSDMTKKSDQIVARLKNLGVADNKIRVDSNNYKIYAPESGDDNTYTLSLSVTTNTKELTQRVQDYLLTTDPSGSITPSATFSANKQKTLESQARDKAEQDARSKAEQSAKNLGFSVSKVKAVEDSGFNEFGCGGGLCRGSSPSSLLNAAEDIAKTSLTVQPGENELSYSVKVTYYIR